MGHRLALQWKGTQCSPSTAGNITISTSFFTKGSADSKNFLQIKYKSVSECPLGIFQGVPLFHPPPPCPTSPILLYCITLLDFPSFWGIRRRKRKSHELTETSFRETCKNNMRLSLCRSLLVVALRCKFLVLLIIWPLPESAPVVRPWHLLYRSYLWQDCSPVVLICLSSCLRFMYKSKGILSPCTQHLSEGKNTHKS